MFILRDSVGAIYLGMVNEIDGVLQPNGDQYDF